MSQTPINLLKKVQIDGQWKLLPVPTQNGKPRWGYVLVNGREEKHPEGNYHLDYYRNGKRERPSIGKSPADVIEAIRHKRLVLDAKDALIEIGEVVDAPDKDKLDWSSAVAKYIRGIQYKKSPLTIAKYEGTLRSFLKIVRSRYVQDVTREDLLEFMTVLFEEGCGGRTVTGKTIHVLTMLKTFGVKGLLLKQDWPEYTNAEKRPYVLDDLRIFFKACTQEENDLFQWFLQTGFRDREVRVSHFEDINFKVATVTVVPKPKYSFQPKGKESRIVPIPDSLLDLMRLRMKRLKRETGLIFPSLSHWKCPTAKPGGKVSDHFLEMCKAVALRAGLNCGECENSKGQLCAVEPCCSEWTLHKFRHTFGTMHLRSGVDIETVATWMGHKDINTTREYLKALRAEESRDQVNGGLLAGMMSSGKVKLLA